MLATFGISMVGLVGYSQEVEQDVVANPLKNEHLLSVLSVVHTELR
jgi:hypothetical protein